MFRLFRKFLKLSAECYPNMLIFMVRRLMVENWDICISPVNAFSSEISLKGLIIHYQPSRITQFISIPRTKTLYYCHSLLNHPSSKHKGLAQKMLRAEWNKKKEKWWLTVKQFWRMRRILRWHSLLTNVTRVFLSLLLLSIPPLNGCTHTYIRTHSYHFAHLSSFFFHWETELLFTYCCGRIAQCSISNERMNGVDDCWRIRMH